MGNGLSIASTILWIVMPKFVIQIFGAGFGTARYDIFLMIAKKCWRKEIAGYGINCLLRKSIARVYMKFGLFF